MMIKIIFLICLLLSVAFFTLLERKLMSLFHSRMGPQKHNYLGIAQPFSDLIKLFSKNENNILNISNMMMFFFIPSMMLILILMNFFIIWMWGYSFNMNFVFFCFMILMNFNIYLILFIGVGSGSFFSLIGSYRASAQSISYESIFFLSIFFVLILLNKMNVMNLWMLNSHSKSMFYMFMIIIFYWLIAILAESNRTPFDFLEGESELVSGFNTEYWGSGFSLIFLVEYTSMMFLAMLTSFFLNNMFYYWLIMFYMIMMYSWIRIMLPRMRYDKLMYMSWKSMIFLLFSKIFLIFYLI